MRGHLYNRHFPLIHSPFTYFSSLTCPITCNGYIVSRIVSLYHVFLASFLRLFRSFNFFLTRQTPMNMKSQLATAFLRNKTTNLWMFEIKKICSDTFSELFKINGRWKFWQKLIRYGRPTTYYVSLIISTEAESKGL